MEPSSTKLDYDPSSLPRCTHNISSSLAHYPSYNTCSNSTGDCDQQHCYVVSNYSPQPTEAFREGLFPAISDCCGDSGPGSYTSCINFCTTSQSLDYFNDCLSQKGFGPTYNRTGIVRDTYCVRNVKDSDGDSPVGKSDKSGVADFRVVVRSKVIASLWILLLASACM